MNFSRLRKMLGVQFMGTLIILIERYGTIPVLTYFWGLETYAAWILIQIIPTYLSMFDTGLPSAVGNEMVKLIEKKDFQSAINIFKVTQKTIYIISVTCFVFILLMFLIYDPRLLLNIKNQDYMNVYIIIIMTMLYTFLIFKSQLLYALYRSSQAHIYWTIAVYTSRFFEFTGLCLCVSQGGSMLHAIMIIFIIRLCCILFLMFQAKNKILIHNLKQDCTDFKLIKNLIKPSIGFMLLPMTQALNIQGFVWAIAYVMSPPLAAIFNIFRTYSRGVFQVGDIARRALWAELSIALSNDKINPNVLSVVKKSLVVVFIVSLCVAMIGYALSDIIILKWTLGKVTNNKIILGYLLLVAVLGSVKTVILSIGMAINKHTSSLIFEFLLNLIGIIFLVYNNHVTLEDVAILLLLIETVTLIFFGFKNFKLLQQRTKAI